MSGKRHRRPPSSADDRELKRTVILTVAQGFIRELVAIILREIWRGGPW
jgi:hypothetical protein